MSASQQTRRRRSDREYAAFRTEQLAERGTRCEVVAFVLGARDHVDVERDDEFREKATNAAVLLDAHVCTRRAWTLHHRRLVAQGGARCLAGNVLVACERCHGWIHAHPELAALLGLIVRAGHRDHDELAEAGA